PTALEIIDPLIDQVVEKDPREFGYRSTIWTASLLKQYLEEKHRIEVSASSVRLAIDRLRIAWKRPRHTLALRADHWRLAKGGSSAPSGHRGGRSSVWGTKSSPPKPRRCVVVTAGSDNRFAY